MGDISFWHQSSCHAFDPLVSPGFDFVECLSCRSKYFYGPLTAASPELSSTEMGPNEAGLADLTGYVATELSTSDTPTSLLLSLIDMVERLRNQACPQWEWLKAAMKCQVRENYEPDFDHCSWVEPGGCVKQCQGCQILLQSFHQLNINSGEAVRVLWRPIEETAFLSFQRVCAPNPSATLSAIEGIPNPWGFQGLLPSAESTWSSTCVRLVRRWLDDCINNHPLCGPPDDTVLPTRVLDLGPDASFRVSLWEPMGRTGRYVCLSYCWGKSEFAVTTRDNFKKHLEQGIERKDLPQTFQDAIEIARELKIRYLWIDALCIIQNEDDHKDWKRECGNMASIYRNSYLTVAAAWANSANGGCFTTPYPGVAIGPVTMRKMSHFPVIATLEDSEDLPILTRAWTYQERLLARRVIYLGRQEIMWDCLSRRTCECGGAGHLVGEVVRRGLHDQTAVKDSSALWRRIIRQYSPLQLTCPDDKLPALGGLAQAMKFRQESYLAGLWKDTLLSDMCWTRDLPNEKSPHEARWRAPSWSWSSIDGPVRYCSGLTDYGLTSDEHARVCEAKCTPAGPSLTGQVKDGFVTLDGFLIPASFEAQGIHANCSELDSLRLKWFPDGINEIEEMPAVHLIPLVTVWHGDYWTFNGVVVKPYGQGTEMTRVGLAICEGQSRGGGFVFSDCERQVVRIV